MRHPEPDTVERAAATPDYSQPYRELGLKDDEYARIREILGRRPTDAELAAMYDTPREQYRTMRGLVDMALSYGFRLWALSQASLEEWDDFENRHAKAWEEWLVENPGSPDAEEVRALSDRHRVARVDGWREVMGMAYLTLVRV